MSRDKVYFFKKKKKDSYQNHRMSDLKTNNVIKNKICKKVHASDK